MPQGMSQWACATVVGRSQLVSRDMGLLASGLLRRWPGDRAAGVCTGGRGRSGKCRSVPGACQTWWGLLFERDEMSKAVWPAEERLDGSLWVSHAGEHYRLAEVPPILPSSVPGTSRGRPRAGRT